MDPRRNTVWNNNHTFNKRDKRNYIHL